jgi:hypothetical protein
VLVDDVTLELGSRNDVAVAELQVFDEEACTIEVLLAADTCELLVDPVVLE